MPAAAPELVPGETLERRILLAGRTLWRPDQGSEPGRKTESGPLSARFHVHVDRSGGRGGRWYRPSASTEQGVARLSSVLKSERAITVNIAIMRAFVRLRQVLATHRELLLKFESLECQVSKNSHDIKRVYDVINQLLAPAGAERKRRIGFLSAETIPCAPKPGTSRRCSC